MPLILQSVIDLDVIMATLRTDIRRNIRPVPVIPPATVTHAWIAGFSGHQRDDGQRSKGSTHICYFHSNKTELSPNAKLNHVAKCRAEEEGQDVPRILWISSVDDLLSFLECP